jgi:hypothetical protein
MIPMHDPNNANRAHVEKGGSINRPSPVTAAVGAAGAVSPGEMGPGILGKPMTLDPHAGGRHSHENLAVKPGEVSRSKRTAEIQRRLEDRTPKYK